MKCTARNVTLVGFFFFQLAMYPALAQEDHSRFTLAPDASEVFFDEDGNSVNVICRSSGDVKKATKQYLAMDDHQLWNSSLIGIGTCKVKEVKGVLFGLFVSEEVVFETHPVFEGWKKEILDLLRNAVRRGRCL